MEACNWSESIPSDKRKAIEELVRGRESANKLKALLTTNKTLRGVGSVSVDELLTHVLTSFSNGLCILNCKISNGGVSDSDEVSFPATAPSRKSHDSSDTSPAFKERRGCYKRRKTTNSWTVETPNLVEDEHAWRKYGQKVILNAKYPRNYFRCTHKYDQTCQATKQVQRLDQEPCLYRTIYYGQHTCKNPLKASQLMISDDPTDNIDSSKLICFNAGNIILTNMGQPKPTPTPTPKPLSRSSVHPVSSIKQEYRAPKENVPGNCSHLPHHQSSSTSSSSGSDHFDNQLFPSSHAHDHNRDDDDRHHLHDAFDQVISGINSSSSTTSTRSFGFHMDHVIGHVEFSDDDVLQFDF